MDAFDLVEVVHPRVLVKDSELWDRVGSRNVLSSCPIRREVCRLITVRWNVTPLNGVHIRERDMTFEEPWGGLSQCSMDMLFPILTLVAFTFVA